MKLSKKLIKKFNDYITIHNQGIDFDAGKTEFPDFDPHGISAIQAFFELETFGKHSATYQPRELYTALKGKAAFNLQVSVWADQWVLTKEEYDSIGLPNWCWEVVRKALEKGVIN